MSGAPDVLEDHAKELAVRQAGRRQLRGRGRRRARAGDHGVGARQVSLPGVAARIRQLDDAARAVAVHHCLLGRHAESDTVERYFTDMPLPLA